MPDPTTRYTVNCPTCESPNPRFHPAVQFEGEASPCSDPWHGAWLYEFTEDGGQITRINARRTEEERS